MSSESGPLFSCRGRKKIVHYETSKVHYIILQIDGKEANYSDKFGAGDTKCKLSELNQSLFNSKQKFSLFAHAGKPV